MFFFCLKKLLEYIIIIIIDGAFSNRTGLERVGVVGPELGLLLDWSTGYGAALLYKDKKKEGSARVSPVAAPMPKSASRWEKR